MAKQNKRINIVDWTETNPHANPELANNGGGYSQPAITFSFGDWVGEFYNGSCGELGCHYTVTLSNSDSGTSYQMWYDDMGIKLELDSSFPMSEPADLEGFYEAFQSEFGYAIYDVEDVADLDRERAEEEDDAQYYND